MERKKEKGGFGSRNITLDISPHWKPKTTKLRCAFRQTPSMGEGTGRTDMNELFVFRYHIEKLHEGSIPLSVTK